MKLTSKRLQELSILAVTIMLIQIVLSKYVYAWFGKTTQALYSITPTTAISSPTIGNKILGILTGIIPIELGVLSNWIAIFVGALLLLIAGYWVYEKRWAWKGRNIYQRTWAILLYGHIVLYAVLMLLKWNSVATLGFNLAIGVAVNLVAVAVVLSLLTKRLKFLRI